jgi:hypothetical protein
MTASRDDDDGHDSRNSHDGDAKPRVAYIRRLILARCPEVTTADLDDLTAPESAEPAPAPMVVVMNQIADIIALLEARLDRLENSEWRLQ